MGLFDLFSSDMDRDIARMEEGLRRIQEKKERERKSPPRKVYKICYGSFQDERDESVYKTVKIGNQIWLAENLKYKCSDSYSYKDNAANDENYGRLYTYYALSKACPKGWHIPSDAEWDELACYVKERKDVCGIGTCLKANHSCWECDDGTPLGTNQFGFSAWAAGFKNSLTFYQDQGYGAYFWSCTEDKDDSDKASVWFLKYNEEALLSECQSKFWATSVRCIKD
jgi:uncharacterized protein (TIGR02145 family)